MQTKLQTFFIVLIFTVISSFNSNAATRYVNHSASGSNDGTSWANAYTSLQSALSAAASGDEIWVAKGTYLPSQETDGTTDTQRKYSFQMIEGVAIYGGFAGTETAVSQRTDYGFGKTNETILSGDFDDDDVITGSGASLVISGNSENSYHIIDHPSGYTLTSSAVLDGFTLKGGNANGSSNPNNDGAAIYNQSGQSPTINSCYFTGNRVSDNGGAIMNAHSANADITNCTFALNYATDAGGAMGNYDSDVTITNCLFYGNRAKDEKGGGVYNYAASNPTITSCTFTGNYGYSGGGVYNFQNSDPTITNCIVYGNAKHSSGAGTQIRNYDNSNLTLSYSDIEGGIAGGIASSSGGSTIDGGGNINADPEFAGTTYNPNHPYSLLGISPCADAGNNTANSQTYDIRQADFGRKLDKTDGTAGTIDIGAYEYKYGVDYANNNMIFVDVDASGSNNGTTWANAYTSFQDAITAATSGKEIWVANGTYKPSIEVGGTGDRYKAFQMKNGVPFYGGFAGTETSSAQRTDYGAGGANETILSGDIGTIDDNSDNCYHIFYHPNGLNLDGTAVLDGFSITKGNAIGGSGFGQMGGGMNNDFCSPTITNCIFSNNNSNSGGAIFNYNHSSPAIGNCIFSDNNSISGGGGGALYNYYNSSPIISNCTFNNNTATSFGGGISNYNGSSPSISNCTFSNNTANRGGGIYNPDDCLPTITNSVFWGNTGTTSDNELYNTGGIPVISYCDIEGSGGSASWDTDLGTDGGNNIDSNPYFVGSGDYPYLIYGISPCADAGDNTATNETTDIRGDSYGRKLSKVDGSAGTIDMGAYEYKFGVDALGELPPIYVDHSATGSNDGSSWANAYTSFQSALDAASADYQIWVAKGTYKPSQETDGTTDTPREFTFQLINDVSIYGGFAGTETETSQRTDYGVGEANETILSGDKNDDDVVSGNGSTLLISNNTENCYNIFKHLSGTNLTYTAVLDGFTISGGSSDGYSYGAAMYNYASSPSINNCTFTANSAGNYNGGGIYNYNNSNPTITNCTFSKNIAKYGAGLYNYKSAPSISSCNFADNKAITDGAGIYNDLDSSPNITNCSFIANACSVGGGMLIKNSTPTITNCEFIANTTTSRGGGMYISRCSPTIINCTFSQNTASHGGGISFYDATSTPVISNTLIWGNTATVGYDHNVNNVLSSNPTFSYCDIEGSGGSTSWAGASFGTDGGNNLDSDPLFVGSGDYPFSIYGSSPCADVGNNSVNSESTDIRGGSFGRKLSKVDGSSGTIDMGAYEYKFGVDPAAPSSDITWDGSSSTDWNTAANWSGDAIPTATDNIIIANVANDPNIASAASGDCANLTINSGAILTVESGGSLITAGTITNNGTFNAKRSISNGQWHMISSPVTNAQSGMFDGDYLQEWDEASHNWTDITSSTAPLTPAKGFGFWSNGAGSTTHTFTGTPNTGGQSLSLSTSGSGGSYDDANLLGNPYPSSIDWALLDGDENGAVSCYNGTGYVSWNNGSGTGSQYIAPMQGFFIVAPAAGTFNVDNSDRVHNGATNYYKSTNTISNGLVLAASNGTYNDELWIAFNEAANAEFDFAYDAYKFFSGNSGVAQLYTIAADNNLSIDIRPETDEIQLGFKNDQNGVYHIGISQIDGIASAILEDTKNEIFHDLQKSDYDFSWEISDNETRFKLHLDATGIDEILSTTQIFAYQKTINIRSSEALHNAEIQIVDMMGKVVYKKKVKRGRNESITVPVKDGVYLVQLISDSGIQVEKVILK